MPDPGDTPRPEPDRDEHAAVVTADAADGSNDPVGPGGPADADHDADTPDLAAATTDPAARPSRAGRDLRAAIGVGLLLGAVIIATLVWDPRAFVAVVTAAVCVGAWEVRRAVAARDMHIPLLPLLLGAGGMIVSAYLRGAEALVLTFGLTVVGLVVWRVADGLDGAARDLAASCFAAFYPAFLGGFASLMLAEDDGRRRIIVFVLVTVASDVGGYAVGVLAGRHPMAPSLSPKKSWEGLAGSAVTCAVAGGLAVPLLIDGPWWAGVVVGVVTAGAATIGDLIESSIKRDLGIKDMGTLLPGHGGIMDRLDSLVVVAPVAWALLLWLAPAV